ISFVEENNVQSSYAARNKAIIRSKGEVLAFTDADCTPAVNWLSQGCKKLIETKASIVAGKIKFTFKDSKPNIWEYFDAAGKLNQKYYARNIGFGATANLFVKKLMFDKYGLFLSKLQSGGDYEFGRRLFNYNETIHYAEDSVVFHPARSTFREKLSKSKRVAEGQKSLSRMNLLEHGQLNWKQLIPLIHPPLMKNVSIRITDKIILALINNYFRYYNFIKRVY
ncbi:uncharacterized protein METZ01_LOCUS500892, partial [marine metagenome]